LLELGRLAANDRRRGCVVYLGRRRRRRRRVGGAGTASVKACRDSSSARRMRAFSKYSRYPAMKGCRIPKIRRFLDNTSSEIATASCKSLSELFVSREIARA